MVMIPAYPATTEYRGTSSKSSRTHLKRAKQQVIIAITAKVASSEPRASSKTEKVFDSSRVGKYIHSSSIPMAVKDKTESGEADREAWPEASAAAAAVEEVLGCVSGEQAKQDELEEHLQFFGCGGISGITSHIGPPKFWLTIPSLPTSAFQQQ